MHRVACWRSTAKVRIALSRMARIEIPYVRRLTLFAVVLAVASVWTWGRSAAGVPLAPTAVLKVDTSRPGNEFALGAVGLSTDARELSTGHLSTGHYRLLRLMRLLGPSVLRIGGSSVDVSWWTSRGEPPPAWATNTVTPADLSVLRRLLTATGWRALLGVNLGHFESARAADEARYAKKILGKSLLGIEIGNEPDDFGNKQHNLRPPTYGVGEYLGEAEAYSRALRAAAPGVAIYGPATAQKSTWLVQMGAAASMFTELTQHYYATSGCPGASSTNPASRPTAAELLSPLVRQEEDETLATLVRAGALADRPTNIGETNSVSCSGSAAASTVFASALWSLDWGLRVVSSGVRGLNFHGWLGLCGSHSYSPICASSDAREADAGEVIAQPEYYGALAARQLEGGRFVPTHLVAPNQLPNLTTWATVAPDGTVMIAIDNLATEGLAQPVSIPISGYAATDERLAGPSAESKSGVTLGDIGVTNTGQWRPKPAKLYRETDSFHVVLRPASAIIVTLRRKNPHR